MVKTYDPRCFDLALIFTDEKLPQDERKKIAHRLALEIQQAIEDFNEELIRGREAL